MQTRFGPASGLKTLTIGLSIFDMISTNMWTFLFFFLSNDHYVGLVEIQFFCKVHVSRQKGLCCMLGDVEKIT